MVATRFRRTLATCLQAGLLLLPLGAASANVLNVADQRGLLHALCDAAHALDGAPYTISWSEFPAAAPLLEALNAGAVDIGVAGDSPMLFAYAAGAPVHAVLALRPAAADVMAILVPPQSNIHKVADLRGRLIGVTKGSIGQALVLALLGQAGMSAHDVRFAYLSQMDASAAMRAGSIDAWSTWQPYIGLQVAQGEARILVDARDVPRGASFAVSSTQALAKNGAEIGDFVRRIRQAQEWAGAHLDVYAGIYSRSTGVPLPIALTAAKALVGAPVPMDESLQSTERSILALYVRAGIIPSLPDISGAFDRRFESPPVQ
jgi:sulfonate transport system substrate-binding protein